MLFLYMAALAPCLGQLDSNSVTVTASRVINAPADQAVFSADVTTTISAGFAEVLAAVAPIGLGESNFSDVSGGSSPYADAPPTLRWSFVWRVPPAKIKATFDALENLRPALDQNGMKLSYGFSGLRPAQAASTNCSIADLLSDARAQAQKLADTAGLSLGAMLAMARSTNTTVGNAPPAVFPSYYVPDTCSLTVKFALGRF